MSQELSKFKNWQKYPAYKDSGIEWLGEIPAHWEVKKCKTVGKAIIGLTYSPSDISSQEEGILVLRSSNLQDGKITFDDNVFVKTNIPDSLITQVNDILICSRNGSRQLIGKNALITEKSKGLSFGAFTTVFRSLYNQYTYYTFNSNLFSYQSSLFLTSTINQLTTSTLNNFKIPLPPLSEQQEIVEYLDRETAKIDGLIAKKQKLIELLKEKRTALISHVVTKGLNPNVEMKESGVEWLGEIPAHWEVKRLKNLTFINLHTLTDDTPKIYLLKYVDIGSVTCEGKVTEVQEFTFDKAPSRARRIVKHNDIIISTVRTYLKAIAIVNNPPSNLIVSTGFAVLTPKITIKPSFFYQMLQSPEFIERVVANSEGVSYPAINPSKLMSLNVFSPPLSEQEEIAEYLDRETGKIDSLIAKTQTSIEKLKEYRTALISAVVTGKVDVRSN
ncbi:restriction endonuclease subunit S [Gloeocapsa sp. PCC 73106]|uniref:restriction endonuclease subunit S n=1 Tax=Gloeocapsa sp. PCC 73106 TaxID=102232 RepID=UPI0002AC0330|nr:restriction endonuclease subunit S [Gloeocapsa sp. PCC 73106]ELR96867.1 restriction endonuclease S subunit [Gloeocapsa sp. PCC 73106]